MRGKRIKKWLEELEEPYRTQALENLVAINAKKVRDSQVEAILAAFVWGNTDQGHSYWADLERKLKLSDAE